MIHQAWRSPLRISSWLNNTGFCNFPSCYRYRLRIHKRSRSRDEVRNGQLRYELGPDSHPQKGVLKGKPPVFIACGYKDRPDISKGMAEAYLKYKEVGVSAELHIYSNAGHGFGVRDRNKGAVSKWPQRFEEWLADLKMLKPRS